MGTIRVRGLCKGGIMERSRFVLYLLGFVLVLGGVSVAGFDLWNPFRSITGKDDASRQGYTEFTNREEDYDEGEEYEEDDEYEEGDEEEEDEGGHTVRPSGNTRAYCSNTYPKNYWKACTKYCGYWKNQGACWKTWNTVLTSTCRSNIPS